MPIQAQNVSLSADDPVAETSESETPESETDEALPPMLPLGGGGTGDAIRILPTGRIFTEEDLAYTEGRTTIEVKGLQISADRMIIDLVSQNVVAEGNVTFKSEKAEIRGSSAKYNLRLNEGVAYDMEGRYGSAFFKSIWDEQAKGPSFRRISEDEALFRGSTYTTCNFPVPHMYLTATEMILYTDERVFMKNPVLWVRGIPCFYWPMFTKSLHGASPWSFAIGAMSDYGFYMRVGYDFTHESKVPDWNDPSKYKVRSSGKIGLKADLFTGGAMGVGMNYRYKLDFERHIGNLELYGIRDKVREIDSDDQEGSLDRYIYRHRHNSMFGKTIFQLNVDWMSDPDIYYDLLDNLRDQDERGRVPKRQARAALTYLERDWVGRFSWEIKDRVSRARYQDYAEPNDDDLNYEPNPDFDPLTGETTTNDDGVSKNRYGRVSEKYQGRFATRLLPFFRAPVFWRLEANALDNLDSGFNDISQDDDERVRGGDIYGSLSNRLRLDRNGRFTWLNTIGVGGGNYDRTSDNLYPKHEKLEPDVNNTLDPLTGLPIPPENVNLVDGQHFKDHDTIFLGDGKKTVSYRDVEPLYVWADYTSRLNARFTDTLTGFLKYTYRKGTSDGIGEFYEEVGKQEAFEDIYDFPVDYHWIEASLIYTLLYPRITTALTAGENLQSNHDIYANELLRFISGSITYLSDMKEFEVTTFASIEDRQVRDRSDLDEYERSELFGGLRMRYFPRHGRYWATLDVTGNEVLDEDPKFIAFQKSTEVDEDNGEINIRPLIGRKFGPKYQVELFTEYNTKFEDFTEYGIKIIRDLHDAELGLDLSMKQDTFDDGDNNEFSEDPDEPEGEAKYDFKLSLRFKRPSEKANNSSVSVKTLKDKEKKREASFVDY